MVVSRLIGHFNSSLIPELNAWSAKKLNLLESDFSAESNRTSCLWVLVAGKPVCKQRSAVKHKAKLLFWNTSYHFTSILIGQSTTWFVRNSISQSNLFPNPSANHSSFEIFGNRKSEFIWTSPINFKIRVKSSLASCSELCFTELIWIEPIRSQSWYCSVLIGWFLIRDQLFSAMRHSVFFLSSLFLCSDWFVLLFVFSTNRNINS